MKCCDSGGLNICLLGKEWWDGTAYVKDMFISICIQKAAISHHSFPNNHIIKRIRLYPQDAPSQADVQGKPSMAASRTASKAPSKAASTKPPSGAASIAPSRGPSMAPSKGASMAPSRGASMAPRLEYSFHYDMFFLLRF